MRTVWAFLKTVKIELPYNSTTILPFIKKKKRKKTLIQRDKYTQFFIAA